MDMIKEFCEINYQNPQDKSRQQKLFLDNGRNLAVAGVDYQELREKIMGEFPVIYISFKTIEGDSFFKAVGQLLYKIGGIYDKFLFLAESSKQTAADKENYQYNYHFCRTMQERLQKSENLNEALAIIVRAIPKIGEMLYREYQKEVIVIFDEYDVP